MIPSENWISLYSLNEVAQEARKNVVAGFEDEYGDQSPLTKPLSPANYGTDLFISSGNTLLNAAQFLGLPATAMTQYPVLTTEGANGAAFGGGVSVGPTASAADEAAADAAFAAEFDAGIPGYQEPEPGTFSSFAQDLATKAIESGLLNSVVQASAAAKNPGKVSPPSTIGALVGIPGLFGGFSPVGAVASLGLGLIGLAAYGLAELADQLGYEDLAKALRSVAGELGFGEEGLGGLGDIGGIAGVAGLSGFGFDGGDATGTGGGYGDPANGDMGAQDPGSIGAGDSAGDASSW